MNSAVGSRARARAGIIAVLATVALLVAACGSSGSSSSAPAAAPSSSAPASSSSAAGASTSASAAGASTVAASKPIKLAYMSFAVANSYDAPMLAAAQAVASDNNATLTVFDAANDPTKQFSELQDVIASGQYQGIITQPIESTNLIPLVKQAVAKHIAVVNIDQILGAKLNTFAKQVPGMAGNVTFVPTDMGSKFGGLVVKACQSKHANPCNVGYMYDIKASALDVAIRSSFDQAIKADPSIKIVAQGQDFFTPAMGLKAAQDMLQSQPNLTLIAASDQGIEGASQANGVKKVMLVGYGGSAAGDQGVASGAWFGTVAQDPASEGRIGTQQLVAAIRKGTMSAAVNPLDSLPAGGVITKANVAQFHAEWPG
ncbi:MAG: sugar ABC transporter substrate-binding protein [Solirubrobacteraceae bacterium]